MAETEVFEYKESQFKSIKLEIIINLYAENATVFDAIIASIFNLSHRFESCQMLLKLPYLLNYIKTSASF